MFGEWNSAPYAALPWAGGPGEAPPPGRGNPDPNRGVRAGEGPDRRVVARRGEGPDPRQVVREY